jgi:N-dimethylarginine dimethylaminohydrolase
VPFQDTMALGCNFMSLGRDRVIAPTSSKTLIEQLRARGFEVAAVDTARSPRPAAASTAWLNR